MMKCTVFTPNFTLSDCCADDFITFLESIKSHIPEIDLAFKEIWYD